MPKLLGESSEDREHLFKMADKLCTKSVLGRGCKIFSIFSFITIKLTSSNVTFPLTDTLVTKKQHLYGAVCPWGKVYSKCDAPSG